MIVWLTGQPGSGKTTLARNLSVDFIVDGDDLRKIMPNPGYGEEGRRQNIDRAQAIAAYLASQGYKVAVALVSPYRDQRERFKAEQDVLEVYLHTLEVRGREHFFASDYEPPLDNYVKIDTGEMSIGEATGVIHWEMATFSCRPRVAGATEARPGCAHTDCCAGLRA